MEKYQVLQKDAVVTFVKMEVCLVKKEWISREEKKEILTTTMGLLRRPKEELAGILRYNEKTQHWGLSLSPEEGQKLMICRDESLKNYRRVEFREGILEKLIDEFYDSQYIDSQNYLQTLIELQDIFYHYKNESLDYLTDDELITFMKEQFETVCYGDLDYLAGTCLEIFTDYIRKGYTGFHETGGKGEFSKIDEVKRWDSELYMQVLKEMVWE